MNRAERSRQVAVETEEKGQPRGAGDPCAEGADLRQSDECGSDDSKRRNARTLGDRGRAPEGCR